MKTKMTPLDKIIETLSDMQDEAAMNGDIDRADKIGKAILILTELN